MFLFYIWEKKLSWLLLFLQNQRKSMWFCSNFLFEVWTESTFLWFSVTILGYGSRSMHGGFNGVRGPFTNSQQMELEHQTFIYKYITTKCSYASLFTYS